MSKTLLKSCSVLNNVFKFDVEFGKLFLTKDMATERFHIRVFNAIGFLIGMGSLNSITTQDF